MAKETNKKPVKKQTKTSRPTRTTPVKTNTSTVAAKVTKVAPKTRKLNTSFIIKLLAVILIGSAAFLLAQKYRGLFIAGTVDNHPITRWALSKRLEDRYGQVALDEMTTEYLLRDAAKKNGVVVTQKEIDAEVATNEAQYGGKDQLRQMAKSAGITTEAQLDQFFELKLIVKKLEDKLFKVDVTEDEITKYYNDNKDYLGDKKLDEVKDDIRQQIIDQKLSDKFSEWFGQVRQNAKIQSFLAS